MSGTDSHPLYKGAGNQLGGLEMTFRGWDFDPPCRQPLTKASRCCALIMNGHRAAPRNSAHRHIRQLPDLGQLPSARAELHASEAQRARAVRRLNESASVEPPGREPHADAVMHEYLHAVGEQVGMVGTRGAEDADHAGRQR